MAHAVPVAEAAIKVVRKGRDRDVRSRGRRKMMAFLGGSSWKQRVDGTLRQRKDAVAERAFEALFASLQLQHRLCADDVLQTVRAKVAVDLLRREAVLATQRRTSFTILQLVDGKQLSTPTLVLDPVRPKNLLHPACSV